MPSLKEEDPPLSYSFSSLNKWALFPLEYLACPLMNLLLFLANITMLLQLVPDTITYVIMNIAIVTLKLLYFSVQEKKIFFSARFLYFSAGQVGTTTGLSALALFPLCTDFFVCVLIDHVGYCQSDVHPSVANPIALQNIVAPKECDFYMTIH